MVKLISIDVDGTLLDPAGKIAPGARAAVARARAAGIQVVINTGRDCHEAAWFARETGCGSLNSSTGGGIVSDGEKTLRRWDVPGESARKALELVLGWEGVNLLIFAGEQSLVRPADGLFTRENYPYPAFHENVVVTGDPIGYMKEHSLPLTKIHGELDPAQYPLERLAALPGVSLTTSSSHDVELVAAGADKGKALALIAQRYGVPLEECAAVGDSENDLPAFRAAGVPIAMGNAPRLVKDAAVRIAPSNREDGVSWAILSCL